MTLLDILPSLRQAAPVRFDPAIWPATTHSDEEGRLCIGGVALTDIADEFHTPAYVIDEEALRAKAKAYLAAFAGRHPASLVCFAAKSYPSIAMLPCSTS